MIFREKSGNVFGAGNRTRGLGIMKLCWCDFTISGSHYILFWGFLGFLKVLKIVAVGDIF